MIPIVLAKVDQTAPQEQQAPSLLLQGRQLFCPWCKTWNPIETYTFLLTPPSFENQCPPIYKHGGDRGCKKLFALYQRS